MFINIHKIKLIRMKQYKAGLKSINYQPIEVSNQFQKSYGIPENTRKSELYFQLP